MQAAAGGAGAESPASAASSSYELVGSGGYGTVIRPALPNMNGGVERVYPGNVTKVFFKKPSLDYVLGKSREIFDLMNAPFPDPANHGHVMHSYSKKYTFHNIPVDITSQLKSIFKRKEFPVPNDTEQLQLLRMPNLGLDIFGLSSNKGALAQLRNVPFHKLYYQFFKVFVQIYSLNIHGYIHYDIRESNVMIKPETGEINIIDFDLMRTFDEAHRELKAGSRVKYQHPPECLMYAKSDIVENPEETDDVRELMLLSDDDDTGREIFFNYNSSLLIGFDKVYPLYEARDRETKLRRIGSKIVEANKSNLHYIRSLIRSGETNVFYNHVLQTIDNYGLSLTILQLLGLLFPVLISGINLTDDMSHMGNMSRLGGMGSMGGMGGMGKFMASFKVNSNILKEMGIRQLKDQITNNGTPYTDIQLDAIVSVLLEVSGKLEKACSFKLQNRPSSLEMMLYLGKKYMETADLFLNEDEAKAAKAYTESVIRTVYPEYGGAAAAAAAGEAEGVGRSATTATNKVSRRNQVGGRSTRRRKRKFNTRNKRRCARKH